MLERMRRHASGGGVVSVACESHRTQKENRRGALVKLAALVREAWRPPKVRRQRTGISTATKRERREGKRRAALKKQTRGKVARGDYEFHRLPPLLTRRGDSESRRALLAAAAAAAATLPTLLLTPRGRLRSAAAAAAPAPATPEPAAAPASAAAVAELVAEGPPAAPAVACDEACRHSTNPNSNPNPNLNPNHNPDEACRQRIADRRAIFEQSRTTTSRQNMMDLSRQRAALYNTTYQGASCIPGIPCL